MLAMLSSGRHAQPGECGEQLITIRRCERVAARCGPVEEIHGRVELRRVSAEVRRRSLCRPIGMQGQETRRCRSPWRISDPRNGKRVAGLDMPETLSAVVAGSGVGEVGEFDALRCTRY